MLFCDRTRSLSLLRLPFSLPTTRQSPLARRGYHHRWLHSHKSSSFISRRRRRDILGGRCTSSTLQLQRRPYVFLPTSWTELKLRLRQKASPTILRVTLQRYSRKLFLSLQRSQLLQRRRLRRRRTRLGAATRWAIRQAKRRLATAPAVVLPTRRGLLSRVREMLTGKGGNGRLHLPRTTARRRPFSHEEVVQVTIQDYMESSWFDAKGRPLVAKDATGRFINPWISQAADGVKPLSVLWKWRQQRIQRELREGGWNFFIPTFYNTQFEQIQDSSSGGGGGTTRRQSSLSSNLHPGQHPLFDQPHRPSTLRFTWIGHATCLIQQGKVKILTDPIFSDRASPFPRTPIGIARAKPAACTIAELPNKIDVCLISHDHYDHLDKASVQSLRDRVQVWIVPLGTKEWMTTKGRIPAHCIVELEWWESVHLVRQNHEEKQGNNDNKDYSWHVQRHHSLRRNPHDVHPAKAHPPAPDHELWVTCLPVQHWCSRTLWDRNYRLWASYAVLFSHEQTFYYTGDTALPSQFPLFDQIRSYLPWPISLAAVPIGAYEPSILNDDSHVNPVEAVQIHKELQARQSVAIHHGSFPLSEEPLEEPAQWLQTAVANAALRPGSFVAISEGEHLDCPSPTNKLHKR